MTNFTDLRGSMVRPIHRGSVLLSKQEDLCSTSQYSSFSKSNTETVAKPARLGPAKNDTTLENFIELSMFW